jgi:hypothetical protein
MPAGTFSVLSARVASLRAVGIAGWLVVSLACGAEPASAPGPLVLPEGGTELDGPHLARMALSAVDRSGTAWAVTCEGLFAFRESEGRRYRASRYPVDRDYRLHVDALDRKWLFGPQRVSMIDGGEWRVVVDGESWEEFSISPEGDLWAARTDQPAVVQRLWPERGPEIVTPRHGTMLAAGPDGEVWLMAGEAIYRWGEGRWSGPFLGHARQLLYDARRNSLIAYQEEGVVRGRWVGDGIEVLEQWPGQAGLLGIDSRGRYVSWHTLDREVRWLQGGEVVDRLYLGEPGETGYPVLGADGELYVVREDQIAWRRGGGLEARFQRLPADPFEDAPWEARSYASLLSTTSVPVASAELEADRAGFFDVKVSLSGRIETAFESSSVRVGQSSYLSSTWASAAPELALFAEQRGLRFAVPAPGQLLQVAEQEPRLPGDEEDWDLSGYLQMDGCFGHLGASRYLFWTVEAYPSSMPAEQRSQLEAELRARYPE